MLPNEKIIYRCSRYRGKKFLLSPLQIQLLMLVDDLGLVDFPTMQILWDMLQPMAVFQQKTFKPLNYMLVKRWQGYLFQKTSRPLDRHVLLHLTNEIQDFLTFHRFRLQHSQRKSNRHNYYLLYAMIHGLYQTYITALQAQKDHPLGFDSATISDLAEHNAFYYLATLAHWQFPQFVSRQAITSQQVAGGIDFRSFNAQNDVTSYADTAELVLKPDGLISIGKQKMYFELDMNTEVPRILVEKIIHYLQMAQDSPQDNIHVLLIFDDQSLRNVKTTSSRITRINHLVDLLQSTLINQQSVYQLYLQQANLHIFLSPLKDSWVDVYDCLNTNLDNIHVMQNCVADFNEARQPALRLNLGKRQANDYPNRLPLFTGCLGIPNTSHVSRGMSVLFGQEHLLETMVATGQIYRQHLQAGRSAGLVLYPKRYQLVPVNLYHTACGGTVASSRVYHYHLVGLLQADETSLLPNAFRCITNIHYEKSRVLECRL